MNIELPPDIEKRLNELVSAGCYPSVNAAVNFIMRRGLHEAPPEELAQDESPYARAVRLGVIGAASGLPDDLTSNPEHFEGFGRS